MRTIELTCKPGSESAFAAALERWAKDEPLLIGVRVLGRMVTATLEYLEHGDGPNIGQHVDDRERAAGILRLHVPADLIETGTIEGVTF